jgi:hypothetical protein
MNLHELITARRSAIRVKWQKLILESYPANARDFFQNRKAHFQNPVGAALENQTATLLEALCLGLESVNDQALVEDWIKIRAVQNFTPAQALNFIPLLKLTLRETLGSDIHTEQLSLQMQNLETRLDGLLLTAFDRYMVAREKLYEIQAGEWRRQSYLALRMKTVCNGETSIAGEKES